MRYCHNCHRLTAGEALFCSHCGASYGVKLCPSRHPNSRAAQVCSQCGSRDLSTPAPRVPLWLRPALFGASLLPAVAIALLLLLLAAAMIRELATNGQLQGQLIVLFLVLALLWFAYIHLPRFIQKALNSLWPSKKKDRH
ncbi:MAG: zinc ribbon domain-containing protein [Bryobacteraceae bacterium]|nr:zinc ribbon domain-containing protein [Bryobacteraceae bacterium]